MRRRLNLAFLTVGALGLGVAACGDNSSTKSTETPPPPFAQETFGKCKWEQVKGAQLSIWSYNCGPDFGNTRLVADESIPGFAVQTTNADGVESRPAIRLFKKAADAPLESILPQVRLASPGPHIETCTLTKHPVAKDKSPPLYQLTPDAAAAAEWDKYQTDGEGDVQPPCGPLGPQFVGDNTFQTVSGDPATVVFVDMGSEIQIFDPSTLRSVAN